jgi:hypothetical protein
MWIKTFSSNRPAFLTWAWKPGPEYWNTSARVGGRLGKRRASMTSDEINVQIESLRIECQRALTLGNKDLARQYLSEVPLWEIAYQLAVLNERQSKPVPGMGNMLRGPWFGGYDESLGSKLGAGSETEVRRGRLDIEEVLLGMATESATEVYQAHEDIAVRASILGDYLLAWSSLRPALRYEVQMFIETHRRTTPPNPQTSPIQRQRTSVPDDSSEI